MGEGEEKRQENKTGGGDGGKIFRRRGAVQ
jgi:hypothetical protein